VVLMGFAALQLGVSRHLCLRHSQRRGRLWRFCGFRFGLYPADAGRKVLDLHTKSLGCNGIFLEARGNFGEESLTYHDERKT
jgi:hypothetical protein